MRDLFLIHGWGFGPGVWQSVASRLTRTFRVHLAALPGYGEVPFSPAQLPQGAVVCGWSLGALLALQWAVQRPESVARLILVGATPHFVQAPDWLPAQAPTMLSGFADAVATDPVAALRRFAALVNHGDRRAREATRALTALFDVGQPKSTDLMAGLATLRDTDLRNSLAEIRCPALLIHGAQDSLMPLAAGRWLAEHLPDARMEVFADAGHAPFLSDPERFAALLEGFAGE